MKKLLGIIALMSTNYVYALSPAALPLSATTLAVNDNSMATTIKKITTLPPIENITVEVNAGSIAGPVKALETNSCMKVVEYLENRITDKPQIIMDGGYTVYINKKFVLDSSQENLYVWLNRCKDKFLK